MKAPDAYRTITEVAEMLDLPAHVLRFWETKFAQIQPLKRGGGRRYYKPDDVELIRRIQDLLHNQGYTIRGVQQLFEKESGKKKPAAASLSAAPAESSTASLKAIRQELEDMLNTLKKADVS
jgi:DNA-binding transcriptional MerR regulator